jgi:chromate transporter
MTMTVTAADAADAARPSLADLTRAFLRIGCLSFGGPAAQIALMHRTVVDERQWVSERDYLSALSFCMLLPGPEAMQLAAWIGWKLHGVRGGLIAGGLFVLPGALVVLALSAAYAAFGQVPLVQALFLGVQAAVVVIVIEALLRVSKRALKGRGAHAVAAVAFVALFALNLPFPLVIAAAALWGFFTASGATGAAAALPPIGGLGRTVLVWGALWAAPVAALAVFERGILTELALFFSTLAVFTFGGAYAVLAWMAQVVVTDFGWLTAAQLIDGLGLAETTPGPLILVLEFVGFLAAAGQGGPWLGVAGAVVTLWVTFVPCFLWIFAGAPYVAWITAQPRLSGALAAITAAVVGVILNLSLWFAAHVFFGEVGTLAAGPVRLIAPDIATLDPVAALIALASGWLLLWRHWPLPGVLALAALAGAATALA